MKKTILVLIAVVAVSGIFVVDMLDTVSANERQGTPFTFQHDGSVQTVKKGETITMPFTVYATDSVDLRVFVTEAFEYPDMVTPWDGPGEKFHEGISATASMSDVMLISAGSETVNLTITAEDDAVPEKRILAVTLYEDPPKRFSQFFVTVNIIE